MMEYYRALKIHNYKVNYSRLLPFLSVAWHLSPSLMLGEFHILRVSVRGYRNVKCQILILPAFPIARVWTCVLQVTVQMLLPRSKEELLSQKEEPGKVSL